MDPGYACVVQANPGLWDAIPLGLGGGWLRWRQGRDGLVTEVAGGDGIGDAIPIGVGDLFGLTQSRPALWLEFSRPVGAHGFKIAAYPGPSLCFVPGLDSWGPLGRKGWGREGGRGRGGLVTVGIR